MKYAIFCFLLFIGGLNCLHAQDKLVLRNGKTVEVKIVRSDDTDVFYTYPGETSVYSRAKSVISYIQYADGRREFFDESVRRSMTSPPATSGANQNRTTPPPSRNKPVDDDVFWQDVKTTFDETEVKGLTRLQRISSSSTISYRDAIQQLKKKAADLGGTTVLIMDIPENEDIEVMGVVYRSEKMDYVQKSANERNYAPPAESTSNIRRRQIAQQMDSYNNESNLEFEDYSRNDRNAPSSRTTQQQPPRSSNTPSRQSPTNDEPDAVYLMNGRVVKGVIEELEPDEFVSIRIPSGKVYEFSMDDVKRYVQNSGRNNAKAPQPSRNAYNQQSRSNTSRYNDDQYGNKPASRNNDDFYDNYSVSGYRGFLDFGYNARIVNTGEKGNLEINTSHGYQINEYFFAGAGLGLHIYNARDIAMKDTVNYPHYVGSYTAGKFRPTDSVTYMHAVDSSYMTLPIFLDIRGYLPLQNSKITPYAMLRLGYAFNLSDGFNGMGLYMNPAVGVKLQLSPMLALNFSVGYAYQNYGGIPNVGGYGYHYIKDKSNVKYEAKGAGGISLKLGVEF